MLSQDASLAQLRSPRALFDCPTCGVHFDGEMTVGVETDMIETDESERGVLAYRTFRPGDRWLKTSACADTFDLRFWEVTLLTAPAATPDRLVVKARY